MSNTGRDVERHFALYAPDAYNQGLQPYDYWRYPAVRHPRGVDDFGGFGGFDQQELREINAVTRLNEYENALDNVIENTVTLNLKGPLVSLAPLQDSGLMRSVAPSDAEAQIKTAYWLAVASRAMARGTARTSLMNKAQGLAEQGLDLGQTENSAGQNTRIRALYNDAYQAVSGLRQAEDPSASAAGVVASVLQILAQGTQEAAVRAAIGQQAQESKAQQDYDKGKQDREDEAKCKDEVIFGFIPLGKMPGYCEAKLAYKIAAYAAVATVGLVAARVVYKQARKTYLTVRGAK